MEVPQFILVGKMTLPKDANLGFSYNNELICLSSPNNRKKKKLKKYAWIENTYKNIWIKDFPPGIDVKCFKGFDPCGNVVLANSEDQSYFL